MNEPLNLDQIQRQAYRRDASDGFMEFLAGTLFFFVARSMGDPYLAWVPALLIFPMRWVFRVFKERFTWPRIGYVKFKDEEPRSFGRGFLTYLAVVLAIYLAFLWVFADIGSWQSWHKWLPGLMGGFSSGGFFYAASRSRFLRHYALGVFCIVWGIICSLMDITHSYEGIQRWALGLGLVNLLLGAVLFVIFLRKHPLRDGEAADDQT